MSDRLPSSVLPPSSGSPSPPADTPLVVVAAHKKFGAVTALAGASLEVGRAEMVGLLGPNGAGKTTLIKAIAGRLKLDTGSVRVFGRQLAPADPRPEIGVVPQELAVYPLLSASENLEVFGRLYGVSRADLPARVEWALAWSDLKDRSREPTRQFSGGMKRRLNIACSLMHRPRVVLLDEPTVGVDPQSRERIYEMLGDLRRQGVSIVLTTHHLEEAEQRCERIVIIDHGRIVANGTLAALIENAFGRARKLRIVLAQPLPADARLPSGARIDLERREIATDIDPASPDLVDVLGCVTSAGGVVTDVALAGATLHDVFISLTGRELRE